MKRIIAAGVVAIAVAVAGSAYADGGATFNGKCKACHGADGAGTPMAPALQGNAFVKSSSVDDIAAVVLHGRKGAEKKYDKFKMAMPPHEGKLSADEIKEVATFVKGLSK